LHGRLTSRFRAQLHAHRHPTCRLSYRGAPYFTQGI
jgi:hypothetical protein